MSKSQKRLATITATVLIFMLALSMVSGNGDFPIEEQQNIEEMQEESLVAVQDRTKPIYEVYKNGIRIDAPTDLQWYIRDLTWLYGLSEKHLIGMIVVESTFNPSAMGGGGSAGLGQLMPFWIRGANIPRLAEDCSNRNLLNPYDNIITIIELWCYARDAYQLDLSTELGLTRLLYWYNTGRDPRGVTSWGYANQVFKYASELVQVN